MVVWEQRWHPLREEWILFNSHRGSRPWVGETVPRRQDNLPAYDPDCALCPGNARHTDRNPQYTGTYHFTNDLPCFSDAAPEAGGDDGLYRTSPAHGSAEVICYHPDHSKEFPDLTEAEVRAVVDLWTERTVALGAMPSVNRVHIFENKGSLVGASNLHPHCQVYASALVFGIAEKEVASGRRHFERTGRLLADAIVERESASGRVICSNKSFMACVPWFALFAYEVHVYPLSAASSLADLGEAERGRLASILREVAVRYDNLWQMPMPLIMAVHQAPTDGRDHSTFPFHIEYHPPLRRPDTLKYLAGSEVGGGIMTNEANPDEKAAELKAVPATLYRAGTAGGGTAVGGNDCDHGPAA